MFIKEFYIFVVFVYFAYIVNKHIRFLRDYNKNSLHAKHINVMMIKKNSNVIAVVLSLSLLSISCKDENSDKELVSLSTSIIFNIEKNSGTVTLPDKVNLMANNVQNNAVIETNIPIDPQGKGNVEGLATSNGWHVKFWTINLDKNLNFDKNKGFKLYPQGAFLPESPVFFAGVADFSYQPGKNIYLILEPQTRCLTFRLVISPDTNNHPQGVSGIFSGVVSERVFGPTQIEISEENIGCIPLKFTSSVVTPPYTFEASYRVLGISEKQQCEIQLDFFSDYFPPLTIDITDKLKNFNDFSSDKMLCTIYINRLQPQIEIEISVVPWDDSGKYEYNI
ncbi:hypothetical protein EZS27_026233 [termite gut metagenome]|uniref:Uncharacterized protein n=1 Tax=termite gut metagenome TaxID=433724 RepID=A0A5J4QT89_9ZZZZ